MSKGAFIIYGRGVGVGQNFATYCRGGGGGGGGRQLFISILFWRGKFFFRESDITCIITIVRAQQQHKGMFLKDGVGQKILQQCHGGGGGDFFPTYLRGGGGAFFLPIDFADSPPRP